MGLFDRFKKQTEQIQRKEAPRVLFNKVQAYQGTNNRKYKDYAKEGYQENAIVYKCVSMIANNASAVKIKVFAGDNELDSHPLISLLERPNPLQSGVEYFHSLISYLLISGNSYMIKDKETTAPTELYLLRPDRIHIKTGTSMIPEAYQYKLDNKVVNSYEVNPLTGYSQVKHIKLWNPLHDFLGLSPIVASAYNIDQHNLAGLHNVGLLKNGCTPSAMLKFQPTDETGASATLTDDQRAMLLQDLETRFSSSTNAGRPMLLEGDFDYVQMGLNPKDMDFLELMNMSAREIALCFGVPAQLVGIADQTYANVAEARLSLYEETIIPLLKRLESDLNEYLAPLYDGDLSIRYDIDSIDALSEKRRQIFANVSQGVQQGILTRNEARERLGLEPIDGGDSLLVPSNLFPLGEVDDNPPVQPDEDEDESKFYEDQWEEIYGDELEEKYMKPKKKKKKKRTKEMLAQDVFDNRQEALERAKVIGCEGSHTHEAEDGTTVFMPCRSHEEYHETIGVDEKALSDLDLTATEGMKEEAKRGLDWRKKFNRGGTQVGVARANQIVSGERMSPDTVLRMFSFFSRHEVDKQGQGFKPSQEGYPSAGRIAWSLWGGDSGFSWSRQKRNQIMAEREKSFDDMEIKGAYGLTDAVEEGLREKVKEHNEKHGDKKGKRVNLRMLASSFKRGIGAYRTNPQSVRPSVRASGGENRWAYARVNALLYAVRTGKFRGGKFDLDLLPKDHPLSSKD
tara:strand:+ start:2097 stop:4313 length:2217 start_codon:yes stop_codon:yes gene_type:complete